MGTQKKSHTTSNRQVAKNRGTGWRKKLSAGKFEARFNPTLLAVQRQKLQKNQDVMAADLGLTPATYGSIERAKRLVSQARADKIAKAVGMSSSKLFVTGKKNKLVAAAVAGR